eukprot:Gregarina_sp_Poly_1__677@NODE_1160_length_4899_cov_178_760969_g796_i0_p3_GENE_NODE_1160_length_4899_cov_178_760969_g796_i0NODE_1160_length_4899_cov_178_760969_g796_i0_p3_ORF_typecomplete_len110_score8_86_NODE_1160_length_4899_cov_178_760969_g796_i045084837
MRRSLRLTYSIVYLWKLAHLKRFNAVALPSQSRFTTGDDARMTELIHRELIPIQAELGRLRAEIKAHDDEDEEVPRFQQTESDMHDSESPARKRHKETVRGLQDVPTPI